MQKTFCRNGKLCQQVWTADKLRKGKIYDSGKENNLKKNKIGHLKIKNYKFERVEYIKYLGVIINEDNNNQRDLQERIQNANKIYFMLQNIFKNKNLSKKLKLRLKNTIIDKTLTYASETWTLKKRDRKQLNIFERKVYRRILGPVYDNEKENWRILTDKEMYASVKKPTVIETIRLNRLCWFGDGQRVEGNRIVCVGLGMYREWKEIEFPKKYYI
jgi:hypothetical protein